MANRILRGNGTTKLSKARDSSDGNPSDRKRRRKVLSCFDCRRRKLQCDRAMPACSRCVKAGKTSQCLYIDDLTDEHAREMAALSKMSTPLRTTPTSRENPETRTKSTDPGMSLLSRLEHQQRTIERLEAALAKRQGLNMGLVRDEELITSGLCPPSPESEAGIHGGSEVQCSQETTELRGGSFKTQFHGPTHPGALIPYISELHQFTVEIFQDHPRLGSIRKEMRRFEQPKEKGFRPVPSAELRYMMSTRAEVDLLVRLYLDNYGMLYHIIHLPSFWKDYEEMWEDVLTANAHVVAIVLLMTAAAQCLSEASPWLYSGNSSLAREQADNAILAVENWLMDQSQKHVTAVDFQIRVLLIIAKQASARKFKRSWTEAGNLVRICMSAGFHRDAAIIRNSSSVLDRELRHRIWAAATELELQISLDRGMISTSWPAQSDCPPPSNIQDEDLNDSSEQTRPEAPSTFTAVSCLVVARRSIETRYKVNKYLNQVRMVMRFDEVKSHTEELEKHLSELPRWSDPQSEVPRAMLELNLRQYILVLNEKFVPHGRSRMERDCSLINVIEQAGKMMEIHQSMSSQGRYALELFRADQLRAALAICHMASLTDLQTNASLHWAANQAAEKIVPVAIELITKKVLRLGREQRQLWLILVANAHLKTRKDPSDRKLHMKEAVELLSQPYYKMVACQQTFPFPVAGLEDGEDASQVQGAPVTDASGVSDMNLFTPVSEPYVLDMNEIAAWTFDDWSFNAAHMESRVEDESWSAG